MLRSTLLAVTLSVSACYAQAPAPTVKEVRDFDAASCSAKDFVAAHIEIGKDSLVVLKVVPAPDKIIVLDEPSVYKLTKTDKDGRHYVLGDFEIVVAGIDKDGFLTGMLYYKSQMSAVFYGVESDGSNEKLIQNATAEYQACVSVRAEVSSKPVENSLPSDSGVNKI